jgi:hypothetical protein
LGHKYEEITVKDRRSGCRTSGRPIKVKIVTSAIRKIEQSALDNGTATNNSSQEWAQCVTGIPGDHAGHVIGNQLGGLGGVRGKNIYPQNASENEGVQRVREDWVYHQVDAGKAVCVRITLRYTPFGFNVQTHPGRPTRVIYEVWVDGIYSCQEWQNRPAPEPANPRCSRT